MKRFRFSLERVLRQRRLKEGLAEQVLAEALTRERAAAAELARVRDQVRREAILLGNALADSLQGDDIALHTRFSAALRVREAALRVRRAEAAVQRQECRELLRERRRDREAVAQLRQRAWERHCQAAGREAQSILDEVASRRSERRRGEREE
jgi:flagellar FliJ protein